MGEFQATNTSTNNKRIAKNTMLLYMRMLLLMLVSLYTSRINLHALGVVDFGIYGVVCGVVGMFYIVSNALIGSINRFLAFEIGTKNQERLNKVFCTAKGIQYVIVVVVLLLAETLGLWFLNYKMIIPADRLLAANWIYQFSTISFCLDLMVIPYTANIIAHERMSAFAYISILTAIGKLIVAWTIMIAPIDRLIWFGALILVNSTIIRSVYIFYCKRNFEECNYKFQFSGSIWKEMFGFAGWNFIGTIAAILRDQGGNILINLFAGPAANAARSIANQVNSAVSGFAENFQTALKPQIIKSYAAGNFDYLYKLVFQGARFSYYILLILAMPILCNTQYILQLWLGEVPDSTVLFIQLILILTMSESLAGPLITAMLATGNVRNFQIIVGGLNLLNIPLSYLALRLGAIPETVVAVAIFISICCEMARVLLLRSMINMSARAFLWHVYFNVIVVSLVASVFPVYLHFKMAENFGSFISISIVAVVSTILSIMFVGCNKEERNFVYSKVETSLKRIKRCIYQR